MPSVPRQIADKFLAELGKTGGVTAQHTAALQALMAKDMKLKSSEDKAL